MLGVVDCAIDCVWLAVPQPTEWQRVGNQIDAAFVRARADFVKGCHFSMQSITTTATPISFPRTLPATTTLSPFERRANREVADSWNTHPTLPAVPELPITRIGRAA